MATSREKYQLVLEAREAAAAKIQKLNKQINDLGGAPMVKAQKEINKLNRALKSLSTTQEKGAKVWTRFTKGIAVGNLAAMAAAKAASTAMSLLNRGIKELITATKVAARIQVLNHVMEMTGRNAGYTTAQLRGYKNEIIALGISEQEALAIQQRFIQSQMDVADATKISRAAQDLATIAGVNSSEAALLLTDALVKQRPILLKQFGIILSLDKVYNQHAATLGKARSELTETEKRQSFLNEMLRQSKSVAGAYETAMRDAGKQLTSLPRYLQEAQAAVGQYFLPAMGSMISFTKDALVGLRKLFETTEQATTKFYASKNALDAKATSIKTLANRYDELTGKAKLTVVEQDELKRVMDQLLAIMPGAADAWSKDSRVIGVNTDRIRGNIEQRRALFRLKEEDFLKAAKEEFIKLNAELKHYQDLAAEGIEIEAETNLLPFIAQLGMGAKAYDAVSYSVTNVNDAIAKAHGRQRDLIIALGQGFDAINDYDRAVNGLGKDLADRLLEFQKTEEAVKSVNKQLKALSAKVEIDISKLELPEWIDIKGKLHVSEIELPDETAISAFAEQMSAAMLTGITEPLLPVEVILPDPADVESMGSDLNKIIKKQINADIISKQQAGFNRAFASIGRSGMDSLARTMASGRGKISDVFKGVYEDFMAFFIKKALVAIATKFIPGFGTLLGTMFDKPVNDRMAMEQGQHFAHYFTQGALRGLSGGNSVVAGVMPGAGNVAAPAMSAPIEAAGGGSGGTIINVTISGNVLSTEFIENEIAPTLRRLVSDGKSDLSLRPENVTGGRDVRIY